MADKSIFNAIVFGGKGSGGEGGTTNYENLTNLPQINGHTLTGNKTADALGIEEVPTGGTTGQVLKKKSATDYDTEWADDVTDYDDLSSLPQINGHTLTGNKTSDDLGIEEIPTGGTQGQVLKKKSATNYDVEWADGGGGSAELQNDITASVTVGGVTSGTTYAAGTSFETIFAEMLDPIAYPTLTNPSATLSATGSKLLEAGATLSTTMTLTLNRGSINPAYGTSGYRSGAATNYTLDGTTQANNSFSITVTSAKTSYQGSIDYAAGEQPKDSKGNDYSTPLAAGSVNSNTINYEFVNALWANTANIGTVAKLGLISKSAKQKDMVFPAQTVANPETFDVPASWTVTAVQVKNDLSGAYEDASSQFTVTNTTHNDAGGNSTAYKRYAFNMGMATGARTVRLKWS